MSNPRKFSDKIALLMQKQAEEAKAFENILREVKPLTTGSLVGENSPCNVTKAQNSTINEKESIKHPWRTQDEVDTATYSSLFNFTQASKVNSNKTTYYSKSTHQPEYHNIFRCLATSSKNSESSGNSSLIPSVVTEDKDEIFSSSAKSDDSFSSASFSHSSTDNIDALVFQATETQQTSNMTEHFIRSPDGVSCHSLISPSNHTCSNFETIKNEFPHCNSISTTSEFLEQQILIRQVTNQNYGEIYQNTLFELDFL